MTLLFTETAQKQFDGLDKPVRRQIRKYLDEVEKLDNPRVRGKPLTANKAGFWRYRIGDYRIICEIHENELVIVVVKIGHRRDVYKQ